MKNEAWSLVPAPALTLSTQPWETESFHIRRCTTFNKVIIPCYSQGLFSICPQWEQNIEQTNKRRRNEKGRNLWCTSKPTFHIGVRRLSEKLMLSNSKLQSQLNKRSHIQAWRHTLHWQTLIFILGHVFKHFPPPQLWSSSHCVNWQHDMYWYIRYYIRIRCQKYIYIIVQVLLLEHYKVRHIWNSTQVQSVQCEQQPQSCDIWSDGYRYRPSIKVIVHK